MAESNIVDLTVGMLRRHRSVEHLWPPAQPIHIRANTSWFSGGTTFEVVARLSHLDRLSLEWLLVIVFALLECSLWLCGHNSAVC